MPEQSNGARDERLAVLPQYLLPKQLLTRFAGLVAGWHGGPATTAIIRKFVAHYGVDMSEALDPRIDAYATFNDFFTRPLAPGARPIDAAATWTSPVDGAVSQVGRIEPGGRIFQAKGHHYDAATLVGGDALLARQFDGGSFATIYLAPRDYHRIHMPCDGRLLRMVYVPGDLFSVNPLTARNVPNLFARNERVVCVFETARGPMVLVLVGATIVGSMQVVWHGVVNAPAVRGRHERREFRYEDQDIRIAKGGEMGRFRLGSTVVLLWPASADLRFGADWAPMKTVRLGEAMAGAGALPVSHGTEAPPLAPSETGF